MEMISSESLVIYKSEKGGKDFGILFNDIMICFLIKYFILLRFFFYFMKGNSVIGR